jgi:hypothetical protein
MLRALHGLVSALIPAFNMSSDSLATALYSPVPDSLLSSQAFLLGKVNPIECPYFDLVPERFTLQPGARLLKPVLEAFVKMAEAAEKDGIRLRVVSATRTFERQKEIWEDKWLGRRKVEGRNLHEENVPPVERARLIMRYSAMPGTSRHHWGTDVDINALEDSYFLSDQGKKEYAWLLSNAARYGFCQVYSARNTGRLTGYEEEKWHWSYMPLSSKILAYYNRIIRYKDLQGFAGAEVAADVKALEHYVNGLNPDCLSWKENN